MPYRLITLGSVLTALVSLSLLAVEKHTGHTPGMNHRSMTGNAAALEQGGQAAFSALIEIVAMLEADPETDWEAVDIDALRAHLLDMNHLILNTGASKSVIADDRIRFDIQGTAAAIPSIHRMVVAHSRFIEQSRGWVIEPRLTDDGATIVITVNDAVALSRLNGLGFYGFMSLDSHHQAHHFQMALGHSH